MASISELIKMAEFQKEQGQGQIPQLFSSAGELAGQFVESQRIAKERKAEAPLIKQRQELESKEIMLKVLEANEAIERKQREQALHGIGIDYSTQINTMSGKIEELIKKGEAKGIISTAKQYKEELIGKKEQKMKMPEYLEAKKGFYREPMSEYQSELLKKSKKEKKEKETKLSYKEKLKIKEKIERGKNIIYQVETGFKDTMPLIGKKFKPKEKQKYEILINKYNKALAERNMPGVKWEKFDPGLKGWVKEAWRLVPIIEKEKYTSEQKKLIKENIEAYPNKKEPEIIKALKGKGLL